MIPLARLMTNTVTTSHPPHRTMAPRARSVRGRLRHSHSVPTATITAAGMSHEIWVPKSSPKKRNSPVGPHRDPSAPAPPTLPLSLPEIRPSPL